MSTTLLLDRTAWDLTVDVNGNIALASEPYSQAQDAASAVRVFEAEVWYDDSLGLPYFDRILGKQQPVQIFKAAAVKAAKTVPGVTDAKVYLTSFNDRAVRGQVQITVPAGVQGVSL